MPQGPQLSGTRPKRKDKKNKFKPQSNNTPIYVAEQTQKEKAQTAVPSKKKISHYKCLVITTIVII